MVFWLLWQLGKKAKPVGWLTGLYLVLSGIGRFLVEFVRINPKLYFHGTMSNAQVAAAASAMVGLVVLGVAQARHVEWTPEVSRGSTNLIPKLSTHRLSARYIGSLVIAVGGGES